MQTKQMTEKSEWLTTLFQSCSSQAQMYTKIIELGTTLPECSENARIEANRVEGCQSQMYLDAICTDGVMSFSAWSDALISKGIAAILVQYYSNLSPVAVVQNDGSIFTEIGITDSLSLNRSNGLSSLLLKIKQKTLPYIIPNDLN